MTSGLILSWLVLAGAPARAAAAPQPLSVLRAGLERPSVPYEAELGVERREGPEARLSSRLVTVRYRPPDLFRREVLGASRQLLQLVVEDGRREWIYDPARRKVWQGEPSDPWSKRFGPEEELDRLAENYELSLATGEAVAGRPTWQLDLRSRSGGALVRRLWVDRRGGLLLAAQSFRPDGSLGDSMRAQSLRLGAAQDPGLFRFSPPPGSAVVQRAQPDFLALGEAQAAGIAPRLPSWLPPGYVFESLDVLAKGRHRIAHYRFSDGLAALSLFQCPSGVRLNLGARLSGRVRLSVGRGYSTRTSEGNVLSWNSRGWRFVLVGPVSDATLARMAESVR